MTDMWLQLDYSSPLLHGLDLVNNFNSTWNLYNKSGIDNFVEETSGFFENYEWHLEIFPSPANLGIATGLLLAVLMNIQIKQKEADLIKQKIKENILEVSNTNTIFAIVSLILMILMLPILSAVLLIFYTYRRFIEIVLKRKYGKTFIKLLDGTDVVWAIEEQNAKSVINILAIVEVIDQTKRHGLLLAMRKVLATKLLQSPQPYPKLFYKLSQKFGYHFWEKNSEICIEDYVRYMKNVKTFEDNSWLSEDIMKELIGEYCNKPLPNQGASLFEILIGRQKILMTDQLQTMEEGALPSFDSRHFRFPILFRIHHSLGDGVSLLRLLLESIADEDSIKMTVPEVRCHTPETTSSPAITNRSSIHTLYDKCLDKVGKMYDGLERCKKIFMIPTSLVYQSIRADDNNLLHGDELSGNKVVAWLTETNSSFPLLQCVKNIRRQVPGTRFTDVLMTALSASVEKYLIQNSSNVPHNITAVLPARISISDMLPSTDSNKIYDLENKFSVALLSIPTSFPQYFNADLYTRLSEVRARSRITRHSPDYQVNYWIMSVLSKLLPVPILKPILMRSQSTLVISNLPGPEVVSICGGNIVDNIVFWLPNRGTTGIGFSVMGYGNHLQMGLVADQVILQSSRVAQNILEDIAQQIRLLEAATSRRFVSQEKCTLVNLQPKITLRDFYVHLSFNENSISLDNY